MPEVACPSCRHILQVPEHLLGQRVACGKCRKEFEAPVATAQPVESPEVLPRQPSRPKWVDRPRPRIPDPWGRDEDKDWPTPDMLEREPLPRGGPAILDDVGETMATLPLFRSQRWAWIGFGIAAIVVGILIGTLGVISMLHSVQGRRNPGWVFAILGFLGVGVGFILMAIGFATHTLKLWVCKRGLVWERGRQISGALWDDVTEVQETVKRTIFVQRTYMGQQRVVREVEVREFYVGCQGRPDPLELFFTTNHNRFAKPFLDVLEYEALRGRLPCELERLDRGEKVYLGAFVLDHEGVTYDKHDFLPWADLTEITVRRNELNLFDANGRCWVSAKVSSLPFPRLLFLLLSMGMPVVPRRRDDDENPFRF
jgi:hypothetical protein